MKLGQNGTVSRLIKLTGPAVRGGAYVKLRWYHVVIPDERSEDPESRIFKNLLDSGSSPE